jgi:hypothetical protein
VKIEVAAQNTLLLLEKNAHDTEKPPRLVPKRAEDGRGIPHAVWLLREVAERRITGEKAHRWLAWAQCVLTYEGIIDLHGCKYANLFS